MGQLEGMVTRYFLVLILALLVTMLSIFSLSLVQTDELQTIKTQEGKKLIISEKIHDLDGNPIPLKSLTEGKVLLNVWASWCVPCRTEHPYLVQLADDGRAQMVGLNYKDATGNALRFLGQLGNPFTVVGVDPRGKGAIEWGVYGVPETFIVDAQGTIAHKHVGPLTEQSMRDSFMPALEKVLARGTASEPGGQGD